MCISMSFVPKATHKMRTHSQHLSEQFLTLTLTREIRAPHIADTFSVLLVPGLETFRLLCKSKNAD